MLHQFLLNFVDTFGFLNVFKYITFRTGLSLFTSLIIVLLIGGPFINFFSNRKIVNPIRDDGPQDHIIKKIGTPTMGGVIILFGLLVSVLFWGDLSNSSFSFFKNLIINLGWFFIPFSVFVIVGSSNAVNLTDGLDGLATVPVILVAGCFAFISYVTGNIEKQPATKITG